MRKENKREKNKININKMLDKIVSIISIIISIISLFVSTAFSINTKRMDEKYNKLNTYNSTLNYTIEISNEINEGQIKFGDIQVNTGCIDIIPKIGGIERVYLVQHYDDNLQIMNCMELYDKGMESNYNAENGQYHIDEYFLDHVLNEEDSYFGTLFLLIKDYQNNYYTNMIIYEFDKENVDNIKTRVYDEVDLLYLFNDNINSNILPNYDVQQFNEYGNFKDKLDHIVN